MRLVRTLAVALICIIATAALAQDRSPSPFCVVPVKDGTPTEKDVGQAWRMISRVVPLPGVPRPIIYAYNRGGVWTIDETRAFVPFGGEFPSNSIWDKIARDPDSGRLVGVNNALGVFALDPGEMQFRKLQGVNTASLRHPYSIEFIPHHKGFVISDASGLYLVDRAGALTALPVSDRAILRTPYRSFDLPSFGALLINAQDSAAVVRCDDGEIVRVASFGRGDYVTGVTIEPDGQLSVRGAKSTQSVRLRRPPIGPIVQGQSFVVEETRMRSSRTQLEAPSIGRTIVMHKSGIDELGPGGPAPLALPFDPTREPIDSLLEIPQYKAVLILTRASAYALEAQGAVVETPGARSAGTSRLGAAIAMIPERNETIFLGQNALFLLLDSRISGADACRTAN